MKTLAVLMAVSVFIGVSYAGNFAQLGYCDETIIEEDPSDQCTGFVIYNHDYSFEDGYCWQGSGVQSPFYGAFGESFDVGYDQVECVLLWLTQVGNFHGESLDVYCWDGGIEGPPGRVLQVVPGAQLQSVGYWPACTLNEIVLHGGSGHDFTIGYWADFAYSDCAWYLCSDENGFGGFPWTCVAPGSGPMGTPGGWQHPNAVWGGNCQSLGIGATIVDGPISSPDCKTWGAIKAMFE